jgi:hypothetical protein
VITDEELQHELRDRLHAEMVDVTLTHDLVPWVHATLRQRRIRRITTVVGLAVVVVLVAVVIPIQRSSPGPRGTGTAISVVRGFRSVLADAVSNDVLQITMSGGTIWVHEGSGRSVSPDGLSEDVVTTHDGYLTATVVNYNTRTWSTSGTPISSSEAVGPVPNPCDGIGFNFLTFADPVALQQQLDAQRFVRVPGTQVVRGKTTIELESSCGSKPVFAMYLDPDTLLPVEMMPILAGTTPVTGLTTTFNVLPATPGNLKSLDLQIPPGFSRVPMGS